MFSGILLLLWAWAAAVVQADDTQLQRSAATASEGQLRWGHKSLVGAGEPATPQHNLTLATPVSRRADAGKGATVYADEKQLTVLRWRTPRIAQTRSQVGESTAPVKIATLSLVPGSSGHAVRQVAATDADLPAAIPDAVADPVADNANAVHVTPQPPAALVIEPAAQLLAQQPSSSPAPNEPWPDDPAPSVPSQDDSAPAPQVLPEPNSNLSTPPPPSAPQASCDRIYNRRDCCADERRCADARRKWELDAIAKISLDITPSLRPDELNPYTEEAERDKDLAQSPVRSWRDRQGNLLGTGRLSNIKLGRVLVLDGNNQVLSLPFDDLSDDDLCFLTAWWRVPTECTFGDERFAGRNWAPSTLTWKASALCHKPLYFEEVQLERYGHTAGPVRQQVLSGAHFFLNLVSLPYQAGIHPPWECQYALGYYRPGSCAPWLVPPVPLSVRGALWEAGAFVGGVYLFP